MQAIDYCPECGGIQPVKGVMPVASSVHFHSDDSCSMRWSENKSAWIPDLDDEFTVEEEEE